MKATVGNEGILIPKDMLEGAEEVDILKEHDRIVLIPNKLHTDPIFKMGKHPVDTGLTNGAERHDQHLY